MYYFRFIVYIIPDNHVSWLLSLSIILVMYFKKSPNVFADLFNEIVFFVSPPSLVSVELLNH